MTTTADRISRVRAAIEEIAAGRMVVLVDDEDRENEGDLTMAADLCTPDAVNFMARHGRGLVCLSLTEERVQTLGLPMMSSDNRSLRGTAFTVSIDARRGISTGISARERAETVRVAVAPESGPHDVVTPGHVFPLRARRGGVLVRSGHTEGSVDLARLAGRQPAAVICEIMREDGEMARMPDLETFARAHGLQILRIADLIQYRLSQEMLVRCTAEETFQPRGGGVASAFRSYVYATDVEDTEYLALVLGRPSPGEPTLVRVQTASILRDVFGATSGESDTGPLEALRMIESEGKGVLLYVYPRGRASLQTDFLAHVPPADGAPGHHRATAPGIPSDSRLRDFGLGAQVLTHLGVRHIRLLTNNPRRIVGLEGYGLDVVECVPLRPPSAVVALPKTQGA